MHLKPGKLTIHHTVLFYCIYPIKCIYILRMHIYFETSCIYFLKTHGIVNFFLFIIIFNKECEYNKRNGRSHCSKCYRSDRNVINNRQNSIGFPKFQKFTCKLFDYLTWSTHTHTHTPRQLNIQSSSVPKIGKMQMHGKHVSKYIDLD